MVGIGSGGEDGVTRMEALRRVGEKRCSNEGYAEEKEYSSWSNYTELDSLRKERENGRAK